MNEGNVDYEDTMKDSIDLSLIYCLFPGDFGKVFSLRLFLYDSQLYSFFRTKVALQYKKK